MLLLLLLLLLGSSLATHDANETSAAASDRGRGGNRQGKIFSLFSVVTFNNVGCQSTSSLTQGQSQFRNGTCYTTTECANRGGNAQGTCASGFGVCCVFIINSATSTTVSQNCTYLQNPSFPGTDTANAPTYTVQKCSNAVCSLRLDFETFTLRGTDNTVETTGGACTDTFIITTNTNQAIPTLCGLNTGYHIYVDIGATAGNTATLAFTFSDTTTARQWDIKVTQVECSNPSRPPDTCLQYQTGLTGRIETFNFNNENEIHPAALNYAVCIRAAAGYCCVQYQVCADQVAAAAPQPGFSLDTTAQAAPMFGADDDCTSTDYIGIEGSSEQCVSGTSQTAPVLSSRFCGQFLNPGQPDATAQNVAICDCTQPFTVSVFTNAVSDIAANAVNTLLSRGVCLEYRQIAC